MAARLEPDPTRFYVATLLMLLAFQQGLVWNELTAMAATSEATLGLTQNDLALGPGIGAFATLPAALVIAKLIDARRLHTAVRISAVCLSAGAALMLAGALHRCATIIVIGQLVNGSVGAIAQFGGAPLSDAWFPPHERTLATALMVTANYAGVASSFLIGALWSTPNLIAVLIAQLVVGSLLLLLALLYFPACPQQPASRSSAARRCNVPATFPCTNAAFWRVCISYALVAGIYSGWSCVFTVNLAGVGVPQEHAAWIGFIGVTSGVLGALLGSLLVHKTRDAMQLLAMVMVSCAAIAFLVFVAVCSGTLHRAPLWLLALASGVGGAGVNGVIPLLMELGVEVTYPAPPARVTAFMVVLYNVCTAVFLSVPVHLLKPFWNAIQFGVCVAAVLLLSGARMPLRRSTIDEAPDDDLANALLAAAGGQDHRE